MLSERDLPPDEQVFGFLAGHVDGGLHDAQAKAVRFVVLGEDRVSGLSDRLLASDDSIVEASQKLARHLQQVTKDDKRISDGALAVLLCAATRSEETLSFVALLKLYPSNAFRPVEERDTDGKVLVRLELESDILPSQRERLQKGAFVEAPTPMQECRVLALDRQTAAEPAQFFISKYLGAEYVLDAQTRTERLHRSLLTARNAVAPELSAGQLVALERVIAG